MKLRSIVCGVDFSRGSRTALRAAVDVARANGSALTVLFAEDPVLAAAAKAAGDLRATRTTTSAALGRFISRTTRTHPVRRLRTVVTEGTPAEQLLKTARREHADLIVLGTRGAGSVARMLLGSTAERVLRQARVPVLAVPAGAES